MWHEMATRRVLGQDGFIREVCIWARSGCNCRALEAWWQNLHRTHVVTVRQRQRLCTESIAECGMGRQRVGKTGKSYGIRMEYVWNNTLATRSQHANSRLGNSRECRGCKEGTRRGAGVQTLTQAGGQRRDSPGGPGAAGRRKRRQRSRPEALLGRGTAFQTPTSRMKRALAAYTLRTRCSTHAEPRRSRTGSRASSLSQNTRRSPVFGRGVPPAAGVGPFAAARWPAFGQRLRRYS